MVQLDDIRFRKWVWVVEPGRPGDFNTKIASPEYRAAFTQHGLDVATLEAADAARRIAASAVKAPLVEALDDWALYEPDTNLRERLLGIARQADPGPWTDRLREPGGWKNRSTVAKLAAEAGPTPPSLPPRPWVCSPS